MTTPESPIQSLPDAPTPSAGRAIVTFGRGWHSLAVVRSLASRGVDVVSADVYGLTPAALSSASRDSFTYPDPVTEPEAFLDVLEQEVRARKPEGDVPYVLQPVQQETYLIAENRERFEGLISLALPPNELLDLVRDKGELAAFAERAGLRVPPTWRFVRPPTPEELAKIEMPVIVKIPRGAGGSGMERVERREELAEVFERIREEHGTWPLIQGIVEGEDICVAAVCNRGEVHSVMTYINSHKAGASAPGSVRESIAAPGAERAARQLLSGLGWHGVAQLDFMWDGASEPSLIEINPRLYGGVFQTMASGLDFPWILFCMAAGLPVPDPTAPELGIRTETPVVGLVGILREILADTDDESLAEQLSSAWTNSKGKTDDDGLGDRLGRFFEQAKEVLDPTERWERVQGLLDANSDNVSQLMFDEDPTAALGMLYPLAIFLKHGKIDGPLLHGVASAREEDS